MLTIAKFLESHGTMNLLVSHIAGQCSGVTWDRRGRLRPPFLIFRRLLVRGFQDDAHNGSAFARFLYLNCERLSDSLTTGGREGKEFTITYYLCMSVSSCPKLVSPCAEARN